MEDNFQYAVIKAAYEAWDTNQAQPVDGQPNVVVIPDTLLNEAHALAAAQGGYLEPASMPTFWVEHEGRRAQVGWLVQPGPGPAEA